MLLTPQDLCHKALEGLLTRPGGESLVLSTDSDDPLRPLIYIELDTTTSPVSGRVVGLRGDLTTAPYTIGCSDDCWDGAGIWTLVPPIDIPDIDYPYDIDCVDGECLLPYEPTCLVTYLSLESTCTEGDASDCDAWGREYVTRYRIEPLIDCGAPPIDTPTTDCDRGECVEQWVGTDWCKVYPILNTPLMPVDMDCYDGECMEACPTHEGKLAICWGGPFEDGVVDRECYLEGYYVSLYDPSDCMDECTVSPWVPLQWRDCEGNIYPLIDQPQDTVWVPGVHTLGDLTIKVESGCTDNCTDSDDGELIVSIYNPPYDTSCVDMECVLEYIPVATGSWVDGIWSVQPIPVHRVPYQHQVYVPMECFSNDCIDTDCYINGAYVLIDRYIGDCSIDILQYLIDSSPLPCRATVDTYGILGGFNWPLCDSVDRPPEVILSRSCVQCEERVEQGFTYRGYGDMTEFYVRGVSNGRAVYVVDIGYLHPTCYEPMWVETWLPINEDGVFTGKNILPDGVIPFLRVREVTYSRDRIILHHIEYGRPTLGRVRTQSLLYHNSTDSAVDVEELAITLIGIMLAPCRVSAPCQTVQGDGPDPYLNPLVLDNLLLLASLLDNGTIILPSDISSKNACGIISTTHTTREGYTSGRIGSIPKVLTTYATHDLIYNDALYTRKPQYPYEDGVLSNTCMDEYWDDAFAMNDHSLEAYDCTGDCVDAWDIREILPSREVSNRAVAWVLLALSTWRHAMGTHRDIDIAIDRASEYLLGEVQVSGLVGQGWTHADNYRDSVPIPTIYTSTNVVVYISLMKVYDLYRSTRILSSLVRIYEGMLAHLWDARWGAFLHGISPGHPHISLDSIVHGLWFGYAMQRAEIVEGSLSLLQARTRPISQVPSRPIWNAHSNRGCTIIGSPSRDITCETLPVYHEINTSMEVIKRITRCGVRYTDPYTKLVMVGDVEKKGYLRLMLDGLSTTVGSDSTTVGSNYTIPYLPLLEDYRKLWMNHIEGHRYNIPSYCYADCLYHCKGSMTRTLWGHDLFQVHANHEVDMALFHKSFLRSKLPFSIPIDYDWPILEALSGKVGAILDTWAHELAIGYGTILRGKRGAGLSQAVATQLDEYWSLTNRLPMEGDNSLRTRIRDRLTRGINSTQEGLLKLVGGVIREPRILGMQTLPVDTRFPTANAKYHGGDNIYPSFTLESPIILSSTQVSELREAKAYGVLDNYVSKVYLQCAQRPLSMTMNIVVGGEPRVYATYPCCDTPSYCTRVRVDLYLNGLYPYPLYVGMDEGGVWFLSRVYTPRTKWMFRPWQLSMEIVVPIGYVRE